MKNTRRPIVWTIAGSDSGGSAGIQADVRAIHALGGHAVSILTAVTAQNPSGVRSIHAIPDEMVGDQIQASWEELPPKAVKTGMQGSPTATRIVADRLILSGIPLVCDPVMRTSSGETLVAEESFWAMREFLFPQTRLLTPNRMEAQHLVGARLFDADEIPSAAREILSMRVREVVIKGGHVPGPTADDYWTDGTKAYWLSSHRLDGLRTHGTGCTFSAAVATGYALGLSSIEALTMAKLHLNRSLRESYVVAGNSSVLTGTPWPQGFCSSDMPVLFKDLAERELGFPDCGEEPLGFYPIVDRAEWLKRLLPMGVTTAQLRIKDLEGAALVERSDRPFNSPRLTAADSLSMTIGR